MFLVKTSTQQVSCLGHTRGIRIDLWLERKKKRKEKKGSIVDLDIDLSAAALLSQISN
jgi:hypothetical protein